MNAAAMPTVRELIDSRARHNGSTLFLIDPESGAQISFEQLKVSVIALSDFIGKQGVAPGQSVAYAMHNSPQCVITILGILYGGYRAVAVNLVAGRDTIGYVLNHSQSVLVLTQPDHVSVLDEAMACDAFEQRAAVDVFCANEFQCGDVGVKFNYVASGVHKVCSTASTASTAGTAGTAGTASAGNTSIAGAAAASNYLNDPEPPLLAASSDALLMYTSGTTGTPKGVVLSHGNLIAGGANVALGHELTDEDRALCVLPLYHINGLCVTIVGPLVSGSSLVLPERFSTSAFWQWVDDYRCTWFSVVPTQIAYLLRDADAQTGRPWVRFGRSASAPLSPDVHRHFEARFGVPLIETMGLTETAAQITSNHMPPRTRKPGSPGVPVGVEARIVGPDLDDVATGAEGELLIRGANVMQRYFRNEQATKDTLVQEGWLRTGDLARQDEQGFLFITGRLKELIIKGGENIAPREIDDALYQHSDVVEAAAFARPCENFGQVVEAAVAVKALSTLTEEDLLHLCLERVGTFKCPDRIHFLAELPKGPSGKIQRIKLTELLVR